MTRDGRFLTASDGLKAGPLSEAREALEPSLDSRGA